jgi:putative Mg2+ transporter-C (MgtC) family protein
VPVFLDILSNNEVYFLRLFLAMMLGGIIGLERQLRGRSAGLRTNILVCLGSAAIVLVFQKISMTHLINDPAMRFDPARAAAGVITGIGFLGAGTIMKSKDFVRGLTTAASIWVVSAVGVTVGLGQTTIAVLLTFLVIVSLYLFHLIRFKEDRYFTLTLKWSGDLQELDNVILKLNKEKAVIKARIIKSNPQKKTFSAELSMRMRMKWYENKYMKELHNNTVFDEVIWK